MREILFRGRMDNGKWVFGVPVRVEENTYPTRRIFLVKSINLDELDGYIPDLDMEEVIPETVGQFTGLYDERGNKVFEGDVLQFRNPDGSAPYKRTATIAYGSWNCNCCDGIYGWYSEGQDCIRGLYESSDEIEGTSGYVIIGNIHDNPELMKEETK